MRVAALVGALLGFAACAQTIPSLASLSTGVDAEGRPWGKARIHAPTDPKLTVLRRPFSAIESQGPASDMQPVRKVYRDTAGRTRAERLILPAEEPADGALLIELNDPAAGEMYILDVARKTAHRVKYPPSSRLTIQPVMGPPEATAVKGVRPRVTEEALGSTVMEGIPVDGQKFTTVDPENTRTEEVWTSPGLWLTLLREIHDPRDGNTLFKLTDIKLDEPDADLFRPPAGYRIVSATAPFDLEIGAAPRGPVLDSNGAYRPGNGVSLPVRISGSEPKFTEDARQRGISGTVALECIVGTDGIPRDIRVLRSLDPGLDQNAIQAVSEWRFQAGQLNGKAVPVRARIDVSFRSGGGPPLPKGPNGMTPGLPPGKTLPRTNTKRFPPPVN